MKYDSEWDVIVVGAGPGGLKTGEEFAKRGCKTLIVDKKQQIGPPKRCGEGLSMRWIKVGELKPNPRWAVQEITGVILIAPSGKRNEIDTSKTGRAGYIVERSQLEKEMAFEAIRAGAKIMLKARVFDVLKSGEAITGVKVNYEGKDTDLKAKIVVACDGVDSRVARFAGMKTAMPLTECDSGYQYEMAGVKLLDQSKMELYFGEKVAPRGYVWIFPKGEDVANVGIGISSHLEKSAKEYLDEWIETHKERFEKASVVEVNAGVIPVCAPIDEFVADGFMVVGDAARIVNPIHGGGIGAALEAAVMAAEAGAEAVKTGDVSKQKLQKYKDTWDEVRGKEFAKILKVRKFFEKLNDEQMEIISSSVDPKVLVALGHGAGLGTVVKALAKASPNAAKFALSFIKGGSDGTE